MKISTGQKFHQKVYEIRFIQLRNFMLSLVEHKKSFISTEPVYYTSISSAFPEFNTVSLHVSFHTFTTFLICCCIVNNWHIQNGLSFCPFSTLISNLQKCFLKEDIWYSFLF